MRPDIPAQTGGWISRGVSLFLLRWDFDKVKATQARRGIVELLLAAGKSESLGFSLGHRCGSSRLERVASESAERAAGCEMTWTLKTAWTAAWTERTHWADPAI
jgi:hypothetical protein